MKGTTGRKAGTSNLRKPNISSFFFFCKEKRKDLFGVRVGLNRGKNRKMKGQYVQSATSQKESVRAPTISIDMDGKKET